MQDESEQRKKLVEHLESAMQIADEINQPVISFLIERALDEARGAFWTS